MGQEWDFADAWVLKSISITVPDVHDSLTCVIEAADAVNRLLVEEVELTQAVGRLLALDLIVVDPTRDRYWLTESGSALCRRRNRGPEYLSGIRSGLRRLGPPPQVEWSLPEGQFAQAVAEYRTRARTFMSHPPERAR